MLAMSQRYVDDTPLDDDSVEGDDTLWLHDTLLRHTLLYAKATLGEER